MSVKKSDANLSGSQLEPEVARLIDSVFAISEPKDTNDLKTLLTVAGDALKFYPPLYFTSIFGKMRTWMPPHRKNSEYTILNLWQPLRALNYLADITVPAFSHAPGPKTRTFLPPVLQRLFWRPSTYFQQNDPFDRASSFPDEHWFFLNGIATNEDVARMNADLISDIFFRPVTAIQNATNSTITDLKECAIGKSFKTDPDLDKSQSMTEPAITATIAILEALKNPEKARVVLICHSQGTIIAANVLRALQRSIVNMQQLKDEPDASTDLELELIDKVALNVLYTNELESCSMVEMNKHLAAIIKKLEVYTFANCADKMNYVTSTRNAKGETIGLPYIENFANEYDLVARLGVLSPLKDSAASPIDIDGAIYRKEGHKAWGHLLNQHYLFDILHFLNSKEGNPYPLWDNKSQTTDKLPRLYSYFKGGRQGPFYL